jgi:hypothetical protein
MFIFPTIICVVNSHSFKNAISNVFNLNRHSQQLGENDHMVDRKNKINDNILGFLLGLAGGTIVYAFLSLFQKDKQKSYCPVCKATINRGDIECSNCHSKFRWR